MLWTIGNKMNVNSKGTVNGISRSLQISGKPTGSSQPDYLMFGVSDGILSQFGSTVLGEVGTNGTLSFNNSRTVADSRFEWSCQYS